MNNRSVPALRRHARGTGTCRLNGKDYYFGPWPDPDGPAPIEVQREYTELISRWVANGRNPLPARASDRPQLVSDLCPRFVADAEADYPAGSREPKQYELAFRPLLALYGTLPAAQFDARALELVRADMVRRKWARSHVNRSVNRVKRLFRWAGRNKLCPPAVYHDLCTVEALRRGQRGVKEQTRRQPATEADVEAVAAHLSAPMAAMLRLLWLTGMRPGDVRRLRAEEVDRSDPSVWVYRPAEHKRAWKEEPRSVAIGPRGQLVLRPWLDRCGAEGPVFSPAALVAEHLAAVRTRARGAELSPAEQWAAGWFARVPGRVVATAGASYSHDGFEASIRRAAERAGRPWFSAYCCRHGARMALAREAGDEGARAVLGQRSIETLRHYGKIDEDRAKEIMRKIG